MVVRRDECHWLNEANKAACVVLASTGVIAPSTASAMARALQAYEASLTGEQGAARRSGDYKTVEPMLVAIGGIDMTRLHSGRSRVDLVATNRRLTQRDALLRAFAALTALRQAIVRLAASAPTALVPVYTQGRQSAAVPLGHYLLTYAVALAEEADRLKTVYASINRSPLGAGAGVTSSHDVDRRELAAFLGFDGVIEHSIFASEISIMTIGSAITSAANAGALVIGTFVADIEIQYARTDPWFTVREADDDLTSRSTSMPHKVNPAILNRVRMQASDVLGACVAYLVKCHNVQHGMPDFKSSEPELVLDRYAALLAEAARLVNNLEFHADTARSEVEGEYSAATELADLLQRQADLPLRLGYRFAAAVVKHGKQHAIEPSGFDLAVAVELFHSVLSDTPFADTDFPFTESEFREAMSPAAKVQRARGLGGPQPLEVERMMSAAAGSIASDIDWKTRKETAIDAAAAALQRALGRLGGILTGKETVENPVENPVENSVENSVEKRQHS